MFKDFLIWVGLSPTDDERKIIEQLQKPHMRSARVTKRGGLTKDSKDCGKSPEAIAFRKKCVQILKDSEKLQ